MARRESWSNKTMIQLQFDADLEEGGRLSNSISVAWVLGLGL
jgi:hypothetical protein